jgi:hypothetical protein
MKDRVKAWMDKVRTAHDVEAITVTLGNESWEGVSYREFGRTCFYLVGELPSGWTPSREGQVYYTRGADTFVITSYLSNFATLKKRYLKYHPFGNSFTMARNMPNWKSPNTRVEMTVQ